MRIIKLVGATALICTLTVAGGVGTANAAKVDNNGSGTSASQTEKRMCMKDAKKAYKAALRTANQEKKAAYKAAKVTWLETTISERATLKAALTVATTKVERTAARQEFRTATTTQRDVRQNAKKDARVSFKTAKTQAHASFKTARETCRA